MNAVADPGDPGQGFDVEVHELAGLLPLVALRRRLGTTSLMRPHPFGATQPRPSTRPGRVAERFPRPFGASGATARFVARIARKSDAECGEAPRIDRKHLARLRFDNDATTCPRCAHCNLPPRQLRPPTNARVRSGAPSAVGSSRYPWRSNALSPGVLLGSCGFWSTHILPEGPG